MRHSLSLSTLASLGVLALALAAGACGSSSEDRRFEDDPTSPPLTTGSGEGTSGGGGTLGSSGGGTGDSGVGGQACAAESVSARRAEVDIIVVIDTSGSMGEETAQVQANINTFASKIGASGLDYTVVMIAETPDPPPFPLPIPIPVIGICVPPPLGAAKCGAHNPPKFHHINEGVASTDSLQKILDKYPTYAPWLRPSAYKVFIEVTDDNSSLAYNTFDTQLLAKSPAQFGSATSRRYIFNSICGWKKGTAILSSSTCSTAENPGAQYQQLSKLTGGVVDSVCETDYSSVFDNIAKGLVTRLGCEFAFPKSTTGGVTDPSAVVVNYTPGAGGAKALTQVTDQSKCGGVTDGWYYDDNAAPTRIVFCPTTCSSVGADTSGKIEIAVGCKAPPPK